MLFCVLSYFNTVSKTSYQEALANNETRFPFFEIRNFYRSFPNLKEVPLIAISLACQGDKLFKMNYISQCDTWPDWTLLKTFQELNLFSGFTTRIKSRYFAIFWEYMILMVSWPLDHYHTCLYLIFFIHFITLNFSLIHLTRTKMERWSYQKWPSKLFKKNFKSSTFEAS